HPTPLPKRAVASQPHRGRALAGGSGPILSGVDLDEVGGIWARTVAQLTGRVVAPRPKCAVPFKSHEMSTAGARADPVVSCIDLLGVVGESSRAAPSQGPPPLPQCSVPVNRNAASAHGDQLGPV